MSLLTCMASTWTWSRHLWFAHLRTCCCRCSTSEHGWSAARSRCICLRVACCTIIRPGACPLPYQVHFSYGVNESTMAYPESELWRVGILSPDQHRFVHKYVACVCSVLPRPVCNAVAKPTSHPPGCLQHTLLKDCTSGRTSRAAMTSLASNAMQRHLCH